MTIKIAICGASGRVGQELIKLIFLSEEFELVLQVVRSTSEAERSDGFSKADVVIDFSSKQALPGIIESCLKTGKPLVTGVTGLDEEDYCSLEKASKKIPVLHSANFSLGITLMKRLCHFLGRHLGECDVEILETHHIHKKDSPSGTALALASCCQTEPAIHSIRSGQVFGIHEIFFKSSSEVISIKHEALDRSVFAKGSLMAASYLLNKGPGLYTMDSLFKETPW